TVKEIEGNLILEFHVNERIGDKEASNFTVEAKYSSNNKYLSNKMTSINQNARVTTVVLVGTIYYQFDNDKSSRKHVIILEDLSIITSNCEFLNMQTHAVPWLSQTTIPGYSQKSNRQPRGATSRPSKNKKATLSNMNATSTQQNLSAALGKNPIPNMTNEQPVQNQDNQDNTENTKESN
ncbi:22846_t:CDS:1, partial [Gigaspora margarita]